MVTWSMTKELKPSSGKKRHIFNKWYWLKWQSSCRMQIVPFLSPCTKFKSKWIKDLHIRPDTLKLIRKKLGKTLEDMGKGKNFLNRTPIVYALRSRSNKWNLIKLQSFCKAKALSKEQNNNQHIGKRSLPTLYQKEGLYPRYTKNSRR